MESKFILFACIAFCVIATNEAAPQKYTDKYDQVNVENILGNGRILQNYLKCLLDKGPCTQEGRELKRLLPDALSSECSKCTETQRKNSNKVINYLRQNRAQDWNKLLNKYDPSGVYQKKHANKSN